MTTKTKTKETKTMQDAEGREVPVKFIPALDLLADKSTKKIVTTAKALQQKLILFKSDCLELCDEWYNQLLSQMKQNEKSVDNKKGNFTLFSFDRKIKIEVNIGKRIEFDNNIDIAKSKIDEYLDVVTKGSAEEIRLLVNHAFTTSRGKLDSKRVMQLFALNIKHPLWKEAIEYIQASIKMNITKRYVNIFERNDEGEYIAVVLQFSNL